MALPSQSQHISSAPLEDFKKKMNQLRSEAQCAVTRAEDAEAKLKKYDQIILENDQEITSMTHKISVLEIELDKAEGKLVETKTVQDERELLKSANEHLTKMVALREDELDAAGEKVKATTKRLQELDLKAENCDRQLRQVEQERDQWEKKFDEMQENYKMCQTVLNDLTISVNSL